MNRNQLAKELAVSQRLPISVAFQAVDGVIGIIRGTLLRKEDITLRGLGALRIAERKEKTGRDFLTKEPITIPAHTTVIFKPSQELKNNLNKWN